MADFKVRGFINKFYWNGTQQNLTGSVNKKKRRRCFVKTLLPKMSGTYFELIERN